MRESLVTRKTKETEITLALQLDGKGVYRIDSGCGFLNHMLELFAGHGGFDLELSCCGDVSVDDHHTVEDVGIVLGSAFAQALGDKKGITRYGSMLLPMDEALVLCSLDISGRSHLAYDVALPTEKVGNFDTQLVQEFLYGLCRSMGLTLHMKLVDGENSHHIIEAVFKGLARALRQAVKVDPQFADEIPSTKGIL